LAQGSAGRPLGAGPDQGTEQLHNDVQNDNTSAFV